MAKVITISRKFMTGHPKGPKAGLIGPRGAQPTYFVEKYLNSLGIDYRNTAYLKELLLINAKAISDGRLSKYSISAMFNTLNPEVQDTKPHTIRAGHRFKDGEMASIRIWSGRPRKDPQIILAPDQLIQNVWDIEIFKDGDRMHCGIRKDEYSHALLSMGEVASNDGLRIQDWLSWFYVTEEDPFIGQIICWDKNLTY